MAGITAQYNEVPKILQVVTNRIIEPEGGINPIDIGEFTLPNVRGQINITIIAGDDPTLGNISSFSSFSITGGFGEFPGDNTQNFYLADNSEKNCIVTTPAVNIFVINTTPSIADIAPPLGLSRQYRLTFTPLQSYPPKIMHTGGPLIGNNTVTIKMVKQNIIQDF